MLNWLPTTISNHQGFIRLCGIFFLICSMGTYASSNDRTPLPLPELSESLGVIKANLTKKQMPILLKHVVTIKRNESLSTALDDLNISASTTYAISRLQNSQKLTNLQTGDKLTIWVDKHDKLQRILYPKTQTLSYDLVKTSEGYHLQEKKANIEIRTEAAVGTVTGSFYPAAERAGLSAKSIMSFADIFAWDVDFFRDIHKGDMFKLIYETRYINGQYIRDGEILAAQITTNSQKTTHSAFLMHKNGKKIGYYDEKGKSLKKAFLRSPVDYVRITSKFDPKRYHPILKKWRSHRGVDYAGPTGTPVHVTGNGKIIYRGWGRGYGRYIKVQHTNKQVTVYGHFSKFGKYQKGSWVKQGQTIGYIGQSGLATGPHLHYEFRKNGNHIDPLKLKFSNAKPIAKKYLTEFKKTAQFLYSQLDRIDKKTYVAQNFE